VAATNRDVNAPDAERWLRRDLYYRLCTVSVHLPPTRERPEEIPYLVARALQAAAPERRYSVDFVERCLLLPWPGDIRELMGAVRRAALAADQKDARAPSGTPPILLDASLLPHDVGGSPATNRPPVRIALTDTIPPPSSDRALHGQITAALREFKTVSAAADALGWHRSTLHRHMKRLGIEAD